MKDWSGNLIRYLLSLHVPHSHPVGDEIVASDAEAEDVEDHNVTDDGVIVDKGGFVHKSGVLVKFRAKEAGKSSHIWKDTVAAPI